ncbi:hypothetical protein LCGC14_1997430, partial [marine sediment metagenome]
MYFHRNIVICKGSMTGLLVSNNAIVTHNSVYSAGGTGHGIDLINSTVSEEISNNLIEGLISVAAATVNSVFSGNAVFAASSFQQLTGVTISDNTFYDADVDVTAALADSTISDNVFGGVGDSLDIQLAMTNSTVTGNRFNSQLSFGTTITDSIVSNNIVEGLLLVTGGAITSSVLDGNAIVGGGVFGQLASMTFSDNVFTADVNVTAAVDDSTISGNVFSGGTDSLDIQSTIATSTIVGNKFDNDLLFKSTVNNSIIGDNKIDGYLSVSGLASESVFNGNKVGAGLFEQLTEVTISDNIFTAGVATTAVAALVTISNNVFGTLGDTTNSLHVRDEITNCTISGNFFYYSLTLEDTITNCVISGNTINYMVPHLVYYCTVVGNIIGPWTGANYGITHSKVNGNTFSHLTTRYTNNVVWNGNRHIGEFLIESLTAATPVAQQFNCSGNLFEDSVTFRHSAGQVASDTNSLNEVSINGNTFESGLIIGQAGETDQHNWTRSIFSNNCGTGHWVFNADNTNALQEVNIIGNNINGNLDFVCGAGDLDMPAAADGDLHIIALNYFSSYPANGTAAMVIDNAKSLGWGTGDDGAVIGSNK